MKPGDRRRQTVNLAKWDESVPLHVASESYNVPAFLKGRESLERLELKELGPVRGRSLLHLQCHFGMDTLSWARHGAVVTGVDFSPAAVREARKLARAAGLRARFVRSNIYDLPKLALGEFDIVYTAKGAICWLPDLSEWARIVRRQLRPGGKFYLLEDHPIADAYDNERTTTELKIISPYFRPDAMRGVYDGTYATAKRMRHRVSYSWIHPVSEVLTALLDAGLLLEMVHEFPYSYWHKFPFMRRDRKGYWWLTEGSGTLPLMWSVRARAPAE
jgi:SAM-dependent methyltransferase